MTRNRTLHRTLPRILSAATLGGLSAAALAFEPIDISSGQPGWIATYPGGSGPAFAYTAGCSTPVPCLSLSSTGYADGSFVGGGRPGQFRGRWVATLDFAVPAHAGSVRLDLTVFGADDRASFVLNDVPLLTVLRQDGAEWVLSLVDGPLRAGELNRLQVLVANNPQRSGGLPRGFQGPGDGSSVSFAGSVSPHP